MQVLITGAGGFIGSHLVEYQLARGNLVTAVDLHVEVLRSFLPNPRLTIVEGDFADKELLGEHLEDQEVCFHLASAHLETGVGDEYFWKVNVEDTRDFLARCYKAGVKRFVHCSSVGVYGDVKNPPADEGTECHPDIAYERTKLAGEQAVLDFAENKGYSVVVVRPAWVYGPRDLRTERLFRNISKKRFFFVGDGGTLRHPIYVDDLINGFEMLATHDNALGEVFIMAGPEAVTINDLVGQVADSMGVTSPTIRVPYPLAYLGCLTFELVGKVTGKDVPFTRRSLKFFTGNTAFRTEKASNLIGFDADTELSDGLMQTYNWLRGNVAN